MGNNIDINIDLLEKAGLTQCEITKVLDERIYNLINNFDNGFSTLDSPELEHIEEVKLKINFNKFNHFRLADHDKYLKNIVARDTADQSLLFNLRYDNEDTLGIAILDYIKHHYNIKLSENDLKNLIIYISYNNKRNSIIELLENLPKNKENPLQEILSHITFEYPDKMDVYYEIFNFFFLKMFLKLYCNYYKQDYTNDVVLIFTGKQGIGKSMFTKFLCLEDEFFCELSKQNEINQKDSFIHIRKKLIVEIAELSAFKKAEIESIKSFISRSIDRYRPPYNKSEIAVPRTASFIGTTNDLHFLRDSENRRFYPIGIKLIDFDLFQKKELIQGLWSYYKDIAKQYITDKVNLFTLNRLSPKTTEYLLEIREEKKIKQPYEYKVHDWIIRQIKIFETNNEHKIEKGLLYFNYGDCCDDLFDLHTIPKNFHHEFANIMRSYNLVNDRIYIKKDGRSIRIRAWVDYNYTLLENKPTKKEVFIYANWQDRDSGTHKF